MLPDFAGRTVLLVMIALAPGAVRWLLGRSLVREPDDPALPERLVAAGRRSSATSLLACVALIVLAPRAAPWTLPLLLVFRLIAGYPIRRALFREQWTLALYLSFFLRLIAAVYGLWMLLFALPLLVPLAGRWEWLMGGVLASVLIVWSGRNAEIVRWLLGSRPLDDPTAIERFTAMARNAGLPAPCFEQVPLRGGVLANAVAVPSARTASVLFTDMLFTELSDEEAAAICAHELAHLEYYTPRRIKRMHLVTTSLIVTGAAIAPASRAIGSALLLPALVAWYLAVVGVALWRARHRQRNETTSDLRAVALCGNAEALVRGLSKLYALGRVPRRLELEVERQATHPSLSRRIRDIRRAAGTETRALQEDARFAAPDGSTTATFQPAHLQWSEGQAATHTLSYSHLSEVRVSAKHAGAASLIVVEHGGRRWTMPLASSDVGRAQAILDIVDGHLGERPLPHVWPRVARSLSLFACIVALLIGQFAAAALALAAAVRPAAMLLAAASVGALTGAALTLRDFGGRSRFSFGAMALAVVAVGVFGLARASRAEKETGARSWPLLALGASAVISIVALALAGLDAISVHQSARALNGAIVFPLALSAALAWSRRPARQVGALGALALGAVAATAASSAFLDRFGRDPFLVHANPSTIELLKPPVVAQFELPFYAGALRLSPTGRAVAITEESDADEESRLTFHIGVGAALTAVQADDLTFVDDEHVLVLVRGRDDLEIREVAVASPGDIAWRLRLPTLSGPRLSFDPGDHAWRVLGWNRGREVVRLRGRVGGPDWDERRWTRRSPSDGYVNAVAASADHALLMESRYNFGTLERAGLHLWSVLPFTLPDAQSRFWSLQRGGTERAGTSRFGAQCVAAPAGDQRLICAVFDGTRTRVVAIAPDGGIHPIALFTGRFFARGPGGNDWLTGWLASTPVAVRLTTGRSIQIAGGRGEWIADISWGSRTAATIGYGAGGSIVRLYSIGEQR